MLIPAGNNHRSSPSPSWASHVKKTSRRGRRRRGSTGGTSITLLNIDPENNPCFSEKLIFQHLPTLYLPGSMLIYWRVQNGIWRGFDRGILEGLWEIPSGNSSNQTWLLENPLFLDDFPCCKPLFIIGDIPLPRLITRGYPYLGIFIERTCFWFNHIFFPDCFFGYSIFKQTLIGF